MGSNARRRGGRQAINSLSDGMARMQTPSWRLTLPTKHLFPSFILLDDKLISLHTLANTHRSGRWPHARGKRSPSAFAKLLHFFTELLRKFHPSFYFMYLGTMFCFAGAFHPRANLEGPHINSHVPNYRNQDDHLYSPEPGFPFRRLVRRAGVTVFGTQFKNEGRFGM
jgi:hypothetical protein